LKLIFDMFQLTSRVSKM